MSQMSSSTSERRLRTLRFGLTLLPVLAFAIATGLIAVGSMGTDLGGAILQGVIWAVGAAIVSVIVYMLYKSVVVKS
jgi:hypothetical protein